MHNPAPLLALCFALAGLGGASYADAAPTRVRPSCQAPADATTLIPDGARAIVHIDGAKTFRSGIYKDLRTALDRDLELKDGLKILDACGLGLENIDEFTAGVGSNDQTVAVIKARGIGSAKTLGCLRDRVAARHDGSRPWTTRREGCYRVLSDDGHDFGYALDDSTLVLSHRAWADEVRALIQGKGTSAAVSHSSGSLAGIDRGKSGWFSLAFSDSDRGGFQGSAAVDLESIHGALDLARGLDLSARAKLVDADAAVRMRDELSGYRDMIGAVGVLPSGIAKQIRFAASGPHLDVAVALSPMEIEQLRRALEPHTQGKNPL